MKTKLIRKDAGPMQRAYSLLQIKSVDDEKRIITGVATTPAPDRYSDVVEPKGAQYKLPLPFLWQHNAYEPIGHVTAAKVTKDGIEVTVQLASVSEPGTLKDRLDEAWQSIKAGLVQGLSIGFRAVEYSYIEGTGGMRFQKWDWLELSAVTIPANADCSIQTVKTVDRSARAASGHIERGVVRLTQPGASGTPKDPPSGAVRLPKPQEGKDMNTQEKIKQFKAEREKKAARMSAIMEEAGDQTLDSAQEEEYDTLRDEIGTIDKHLERLELHEKAVAARAVNVTPAVDATPEERAAAATTARSGQHVMSLEKKLAPGVAFARYAGMMAIGKGSVTEALRKAQEVFPEDKKLHSVIQAHDRIQKAAVDIGTTTDADYAAPLVNYQIMASEFIEFLRPQTILGRIPGLRRVPFNIKVPRQTNGGTAGWVGEAKPKGVTAIALDSVTLTPLKLATIAVISQELARFSSPSAETIIRDTLAGAIIQQMDRDFVDPTNAGTSNVKPASITYGVSAIASGGDTEEKVVSDIKRVFAPFIAASLSPANGVWIMSATTALSLSLMLNPLGQPAFPGVSMAGGTFKGLPVVVSEAVGNIVILVNASDILLADDGGVTIDSSSEASVQMDSAPDDPATGSTVFVSLWQQNLLGIRAERFVNWTKARTAAVQYISGVEWGLETT